MTTPNIKEQIIARRKELGLPPLTDERLNMLEAIQLGINAAYDKVIESQMEMEKAGWDTTANLNVLGKVQYDVD